MNSIGIDLGTTNSVACTIRHGRFEYLNFSGKDLLPSAILFNSGKLLVGSAAKRRSKLNADHFISSAKTYMGDHSHTWNIDGRIFTPTDVASEVLKEIYKTAKKFFGNDEPIVAVITTPAQFSFDQNKETKIAGENAGFVVKQILAEPVAAAMAYAFENAKPKEKIYVLDLGGGTFDVALLESTGRNGYQTLMKGGNRSLGGDNFDQSVVNLMMSEIRKSIGVDLSKLEKSGLSAGEYAKTLQKLYSEAEKVKCALSNSENEKVDLTNVMPYKNGFYDLHMSISRHAFLNEAEEYVREIENVIRRSFENTDYSAEDVDRVILVGGSANMPFVRECVQKFFHKEPYAHMDLSKLVAMGAAILSDAELGNGIDLHDIIAHSFGLEIIGNRMSIMLKQNEEYPCQFTDTFYTVHDYQEAVDIMAYEGEDTEDVSQNRYIGGFTLDNIERAPAGKEIVVRFEFDESCILHIMAKDPKTEIFKEVELDPTMEQRPPERNKTMPYDIVLLLDNSGSMYSSLDTAKDACRRLVLEMIDMKLHRVAFITFESSVRLHNQLTHNKNDLISSINAINVGGSTDMAGALRMARNELNNLQAEPLIIIVTDGIPDSKIDTTYQANLLKENGVKIVTIGAGNVDHNYLTSLASGAQDYYPIKDMSGLTGAFKSIINSLRLHV